MYVSYDSLFGVPVRRWWAPDYAPGRVPSVLMSRTLVARHYTAVRHRHRLPPRRSIAPRVIRRGAECRKLQRGDNRPAQGDRT